MIRRFGRFGEFMGCTNYPRCTSWQPIQRYIVPQKPQTESIRPHVEAETQGAESAKTPETPARSEEMTTRNSMTQSIETITPAKAAALLAKNVQNNRPIVKQRVDAMAALMKAGEFYTTPEGIMLDTEDRLIDGQHRLSAVVLSGCTVKLVVWRNVPFHMMEAVNTGTSRTLSDVLTVTNNLGVEGAPKVAVARAFAINLLLNPAWNTKKLTIAEYEKVRDSFAKDLEWSLREFPSNGGGSYSLTARRIRSTMVMGALAIAHKKFPDKVEEFARKADKGFELTETDPAYALRRYVDNTPMTGGGAPRVTIGYATFRAVYAAIKGEKLSIIRPSLLTEANPEFNKILRFFEVIE